MSARFDEFFEEEHEEEGVGPETPPAEPISVEVIIAIDEKGIIILHSLTPISTLMHSQVVHNGAKIHFKSHLVSLAEVFYYVNYVNVNYSVTNLTVNCKYLHYFL